MTHVLDSAPAGMIPQAEVLDDAPAVRWSLAERVGFRFAFAIALLSLPQLSPMIANYLFFESLQSRAQAALGAFAGVELDPAGNMGAFVLSRLGGDHSRLADVIVRYRANGGALIVASHMLALLIVAVAVTVVWSIADRRRAEYSALHRWLHVYARYAVALVSIIYAVVKVVPTQFGFLTPGEMLRPFGQLSRFTVLWNFMATSTLYTVFAGLVELAAVLLLFFRRTTPVGALLLGAAATNIVVMDLGYRVPSGALLVAVKLLVLDAIVLAPYVPSLIAFFFQGRNTALPQEPGVTKRQWRYTPLVTSAVFALLVFVRVHEGLELRRAYFGTGHSVFGLFDVDSFTRKGAVVTPLADDASTWKRVANDGRYDGTGLSVQFANADVRQYRLTDDAASQTWTVRQGSTDVATLRYTTAPDGTVTLDGSIGDDPVTMRLRRVDPRKFPLLSQP
jgi:hypothetical protein